MARVEDTDPTGARKQAIQVEKWLCSLVKWVGNLGDRSGLVQWSLSPLKSATSLQLTYAKEDRSMMTSVSRSRSEAQYTHTMHSGCWRAYTFEHCRHLSESRANDVAMTAVKTILITVESHRLNSQRRLCNREERAQIGTKLNKYSPNCAWNKIYWYSRDNLICICNIRETKWLK